LSHKITFWWATWACRLILSNLFLQLTAPVPRYVCIISTAPKGNIRLAEFCLARLNARGNHFRICESRVKIRFVTPDLCPWYGATQCGGADLRYPWPTNSCSHFNEASTLCIQPYHLNSIMLFFALQCLAYFPQLWFSNTRPPKTAVL
jgi:hypothetical protein